MKNYLLFILLAFMACQPKTALQETKVDRVQHSVFFTANDLEKTASGTAVFLSEKIDVPARIPTPFIMLSGYVKDPGFAGNLAYRTLAGNEWSDWHIFPRLQEGKTPGRTVFGVQELDAQTTYVQIKSDQPSPAPFVIRLFMPGHSDPAESASARNGSVNCACEQPDFCGRMCWCPSGNCPLDNTPAPTQPTHIIVHHSAGHTTSSDFAAVVRSYYDFHVNTNGWDDIGYNWLIDPDGVIYEGRGEGLQGAHFSCMNQNTTGICMIGNYETAVPSAASIEALQDFIAWEACSKNIDVLASDVHVSSSTNLANVSGHRDGNGLPNSCTTTVCPGANLYPMLADIRETVAGMGCYEDVSSAVNELADGAQITIFPNPVIGAFQIQWENIEVKNIRLYNASGQAIRQIYEPGFTGNAVQSSALSNAVPGLYFARFYLADGRMITRKIVVL